ncbi:hypothetical protein GQ457_13G014460 [Hibiscus cannabinus]
MGKIGWNSKISEGEKSELVLEICSMSTIPITCPHKYHSNNTRFTDWYRLLGVAENSGFQQIKRRYHKLALQLHPDKNKHPKAEIAFKLVSEAYACLSDNAKRRVFNIERWKHFCHECNRIPYSNDISQRSKSGKFLRNLREIGDRLREEIRVIENCLRMNSMSRRDFPSTNKVYELNKQERETPVFEPSDYMFQGYPHLRGQIFKELQRGRYHSPIFQNSGGMFKSRSVCIHS